MSTGQVCRLFLCPRMSVDISEFETSTRLDLVVVVVGENPEVQLPHWYVQRDNYGRDGQRHFRPRVSFQRVFALADREIIPQRVETGP